MVVTWSVRASGGKSFLNLASIWGVQVIACNHNSPHTLSYSQLIVYAIACCGYCSLQLFHELSRTLESRMLDR